MPCYILKDDDTVQEVAFTEYLQWLGDGNRVSKRIARTNVTDNVQVSTVFMGIDHSFTDGMDPILFETMVFGGPLDRLCDRYRTRSEALAGHEHVVTLVKAAELPHGEATLLFGGEDALLNLIKVTDDG